MKILQLVTKRQYRGAELSAYFLSKQLIELGHEIFWVGLYAPGNDILDLPGAINHDLPGEKKPFLNFKKVNALKKFIKENKIDVVQANGSDNLKYAVAALSGIKNIPLVYRNISQVSFWLKNAIIKKAFTKLLLSQVDNIVSVGVQSMNDINEIFPSFKNKTSVISRGVPDEKIDRLISSEKIKSEFGFPKNSKILMWAGSFSHEKNPEFMISVMKEILKDLPDAKLIMAGKGPLLKIVEEEVIKQNLQNEIILPGYRSDLPVLFAASELFLLCSNIEGVPGVVLEAGIQETPTVAVSVGGVKEVVINNETGILLNEHDILSFSKAIKELLNDEIKRNEFGKKSRHFVLENYNEKINAIKFEMLYKKLIKKS